LRGIGHRPAAALPGTAGNGGRSGRALPQALLQQGLRLRDRASDGEVTAHCLRVMAGRLRRTLRVLIGPIKTHAANERFAKFLEIHLDEVFVYRERSDMDATNWRGEQAIRPAVVNHQVWGGNRTWTGAQRDFQNRANAQIR
jgi:transposase